MGRSVPSSHYPEASLDTSFDFRIGFESLNTPAWSWSSYTFVMVSSKMLSSDIMVAFRATGMDVNLSPTIKALQFERDGDKLLADCGIVVC